MSKMTKLEESAAQLEDLVFDLGWKATLELLAELATARGESTDETGGGRHESKAYYRLASKIQMVAENTPDDLE